MTILKSFQTLDSNHSKQKNIHNVKVYRMSNPEHECPWGLRAVKLLTEKGIAFEDHKLASKAETESFKTQYEVATTPQIFFGDTRIGGYTDLAAYFDIAVEKAEYSYTPVIVLFSVAALMTIALSQGLMGFMGISLSMLAALKLMDIQSFADSFAKYDLITKRWSLYGKIYPFAELLIGLGLLSNISPLLTGIAATFVGVAGTISVFKAVYIDKLSLNCACIGGNSKAPLGVVSFAENGIMAVMGLFVVIQVMVVQGLLLI